jgi:hypothetical protein
MWVCTYIKHNLFDDLRGDTRLKPLFDEWKLVDNQVEVFGVDLMLNRSAVRGQR